MKASFEWLRAFVPLEAGPAWVRDILTAHTATVEELLPLRADLAAIVVARVTEASRHPDSDHLWVTKVDAGGPTMLEVVCGAPNVTAGALYPFAHVGTTMPNGMKIERRKIRGVVSNGMLCSARELGLGDDHQGIMALDVDAAPGTPLLDVMPVGDTRIELDVGANRPDLLSHIGLARELSAITGAEWQLPEIPNLVAELPAPSRVQVAHPGADVAGTLSDVRVVVEGNTRTRRYMAARVSGVTVAASPEWLVKRLEAVGVRSINNVVDATNYVLHELGQPVHAFDASRLQGGTVSVRRAHAGEDLVTLDGVRRTLPADAIVIADRQVQAVAGIMGGRDSEVTAETRDLFIEVASFDPKLTRAARRLLGLNTDASYRFERGVDPEIGPLAMDRVLRIIVTLAGGKIAVPPLDLVCVATGRNTIALRAKRLSQVLGAHLPLDRARRYLDAAGFETAAGGAGELSAVVPSWRSDVNSEIDLVEEVARFHGYDAFPVEIRPFRPTSTRDDPLWVAAGAVRGAMVGLGFYESRPMPFVPGGDPTHVRVANPLSENEAHLRRSVIETLARRAEYNLAQRVGDVRLFEIGSAFEPAPAGVPKEELRLGVVLMGRRRPPHFTEPNPPAFDEWDAKGIAERAAQAAHPTRHLTLRPDGGDGLWRIEADGRAIGTVSRLDLDAPVWASQAYAIELCIGEVEARPPAPAGQHRYAIDVVDRPLTAVARYLPLPNMPAVEIDLALLIPRGTKAADVERVIRASAGDLLERLDLFDEYRGDGIGTAHRSLAWRLTFRHPERTLREREIEGRRAKILGALEEELHVRLRTA